MTALHEKLRSARTSAGLTRPALARELNVSPQTIWRIETAQTEPKQSTVDAWLRVCDAPPHVIERVDLEFAAMQALAELSHAARERVLAWANAK